MIREVWICVIRVSFSAAGLKLLPILSYDQPTIDQCCEGGSSLIIMLILVILVILVLFLFCSLNDRCYKSGPSAGDFDH